MGSDRRVCSSVNGRDGWVEDLQWGGGYPTDTLADITTGVAKNGTPTWVVVGNNGSIYSRNAADPVWKPYFQPRDQDFEHVVYGNHPVYGPSFIANTGGLYSENLWFSHDGVSWKLASFPRFPRVIVGGFNNLYYEPTKNLFIVLNMVEDKTQQMMPVVYLSENGEAWVYGSGFSADIHSFNDIIYLNDQNKFVSVGVQKNGNGPLQGDTEISPDAINWTAFTQKTAVLNSVIYSETTKQLIATPLQFNEEDGIFTADGIVNRTLESNWVPAQLDNSGLCVGQKKTLDLFSKPVVIKDKSGKEHFIATPYYPSGCAYWADSPNSWTASDHLWN